MASNINESFPVAGTPTTQSVRNNFAAAKTEIEALQTGKQNALGYTPENAAMKGVANGYASLGSDGKVPSGQLPAYIDDVVEYANLASFPATGTAGVIYVALDTNQTYRWSGSAYVVIAAGAVQSVAGKTGVVTLTKSDVGLDQVDNTSDANKPISTATQTALNAKAPINVPVLIGTRETRVAMSANDVDLAAGNYFTKTITTATTFTVSNVPTAGAATSIILDLTNGGSGTITWWSGVKWAGGSAPTLTAAGRDVLGFFTHDGGTSWVGLVLGKDLK